MTRKQAVDVWYPMSTAPKDNTEIQVRMPGHGADSVVAWVDDLLDRAGNECGGWMFTREQEPPDSWTDGICWEVNEDGEQSVKPTGWKSLPPFTEVRTTTGGSRG